MTDFQRVLDRAQVDFDFYLALQTNPRQALAPYGLSEAELRALIEERVELWEKVALLEAYQSDQTPVFPGDPAPGPPPPPPPPPPGPPPPPPPPGPPPPPPPPPGPPPPPPPPGPPPPPPPPPGPPPPPPPGIIIGPGPVPPPPPPPPGGIGINIVGHHDWLNTFGNWLDFAIDQILLDEIVVGAVLDAQNATDVDGRLAALDRLMGRIG